MGIYIPKWERLDHGLDRVEQFGIASAQGKIQLCQAISDKEISIQVLIEKDDPDVGGKTLKGRMVDVPPRLSPSDFDWNGSRPKQPWPTGPEAGRLSDWDWKPRVIDLIEVSTSDVIGIFADVKIETVPAAPPRVANKVSANKGGAPRKYDWDKFYIEIIRIADLDGLEDRTELTRRMTEWCDREFPSAPDPSAIRGHISKIWSQLGKT